MFNILWKKHIGDVRTIYYQKENSGQLLSKQMSTNEILVSEKSVNQSTSS